MKALLHQHEDPVSIKGTHSVSVEEDWYDELVEVTLSLRRNAERLHVFNMCEEIKVLVNLVRNRELGQRLASWAED
jgi:hypothetical protein